MRLDGRRAVWLLIAAGTAIRLVVAVTTHGHDYDMESWRIVDAAIRSDPFAVYEQVNQIGAWPRWPYPPGFWPALLASSSLDAPLGIPFESLVRLPIIVADAGIALLVWRFLGMRGAETRTRLGGAGLVALSPVLGYISGWWGQFDALAILPAVAALVVWESPGMARRALLAGLLIGVGAALKTVPGLMLLALLPSVRSRREAFTLIATAVAVPLVLLVPHVVAQPPSGLHGGMATIVTYEGPGGVGGLSLVAQPSLAVYFVEGAQRVHHNGLTAVLTQYGSVLTVAALLAIGWLTLRRRPSAALAATLVWLVVYVFGYAFSFQYFVWGLPFFIMAGYLRTAALLQLALVAPLVLFHTRPHDGASYTAVYVALMLGVWLGFLIALLRLTRRIATRPAAPGPTAV